MYVNMYIFYLRQPKRRGLLRQARLMDVIGELLLELPFRGPLYRRHWARLCSTTVDDRQLAGLQIPKYAKTLGIMVVFLY